MGGHLVVIPDVVGSCCTVSAVEEVVQEHPPRLVSCNDQVTRAVEMGVTCVWDVTHRLLAY